MSGGIKDDIIFDDEFSRFDIAKAKEAAIKIQEICRDNPLENRIRFRNKTPLNALKICYDSTEIRQIEAIITPETTYHKYEFDYNLPMALISNPHIEEKAKIPLLEKMKDFGALEIINFRNFLHQTPLHLGVLSHQKWVVDWLLKNGAAVDKPLLCGITPLMIASYFEDLYAASLLIHYGANINARTEFPGWWVCDVTMLGNHCYMENFLMEMGADTGNGYFMIL